MAKQAVKKSKAKETPKRGRGRPPTPVHSDTVEAEVQKFASVGCTQQEIAVLLEIPAATLMRKYGESYEKGLANLKQSLRRKQVDLADGGNVTMLIWLGKNLLGQKDRSEVTGKDGASLVPGTIVFTMPRNGRDTALPAAKVPPQAPKAPPAEPPPKAPPPPPPPPPRIPPPPPARYRGGGRDSRVVEDVRNLKPVTDDIPGASTGRR